MNIQLPQGIVRHGLQAHHDERGWLAEFFREEWNLVRHPVQWNGVFSRPGTLRGVHVHVRHWDYLIVVKGRMLLGLKDLRRGAETFGLAAMVELTETVLEAWIIPPGVAHGFFFPVEAMSYYAVSEYWNLDDELGCRWNDPELELSWPVSDPLLSERDRHAPSFRQLLQQLAGVDFARPPGSPS